MRLREGFDFFLPYLINNIELRFNEFTYKYKYVYKNSNNDEIYIDWSDCLEHTHTRTHSHHTNPIDRKHDNNNADAYINVYRVYSNSARDSRPIKHNTMMMVMMMMMGTMMRNEKRPLLYATKIAALCDQSLFLSLSRTSTSNIELHCRHILLLLLLLSYCINVSGFFF